MPSLKYCPGKDLENVYDCKCNFPQWEINEKENVLKKKKKKIEKQSTVWNNVTVQNMY